MKNVFVTAAMAAVFCTSQLSFADTIQPIPPAQMSCADFLAVEDVYKPALIYWISGVDKLGVSETVTTIVDVATPVGAVVGECRQAPHARLASKVRDLYDNGSISLFKHN
jgi:acid stress chaperone HdeA